MRAAGCYVVPMIGRTHRAAGTAVRTESRAAGFCRRVPSLAAVVLLATAGVMVGGDSVQSGEDVFRSGKSRDRFGRPEQRFFNDLLDVNLLNNGSRNAAGDY